MFVKEVTKEVIRREERTVNLETTLEEYLY